MMISLFESKAALGGTIEIVLVGEDQKQLKKTFSEIWSQVLAFERRFSRFIPDSELSAFNRGSGKLQKLSPEFQDILKAAKKCSEETEELYNPFILPALQRAGYKQSLMPGYEDDWQPDYSRREVVSVRQLQIKDGFARIPEHSAIDLGGIGKGYLAHQLAQNFGTEVDGYWFSIGGDIAVGGKDEHGEQWHIQVQDSSKPEHVLATVKTNGKNLGVATSGVTKRKGSGWHHIIDPRTLKPSATDVVSATVVHTSATDADVLASCAVLLGSKQALPFLKKHNAQAAVLQCKDEHGKIFTQQFGDQVYLKKVEVPA